MGSGMQDVDSLDVDDALTNYTYLGHRTSQIRRNRCVLEYFIFTISFKTSSSNNSVSFYATTHSIIFTVTVAISIILVCAITTITLSSSSRA